MSRDIWASVEREVEDYATACIRNNVRPQEAIALLRQAWGLALDDLKRVAEYGFDEAARSSK